MMKKLLNLLGNLNKKAALKCLAAGLTAGLLCYYLAAIGHIWAGAAVIKNASVPAETVHELLTQPFK